jgi:hypothetical protein
MTRPAPGMILIVTLLLVLASAAVATDTVAVTAWQAVVRAGPDRKQRMLAIVRTSPWVPVSKRQSCQGSVSTRCRMV